MLKLISIFLLPMILFFSCVKKKHETHSDMSSRTSGDASKAFYGMTMGNISQLHAYKALKEDEALNQALYILDSIKLGHYSTKIIGKEYAKLTLTEGIADLMLGCIAFGSFSHDLASGKFDADASAILFRRKGLPAVLRSLMGTAKVLDYVVKNPTDPFSKKLLIFVSKRMGPLAKLVNEKFAGELAKKASTASAVIAIYTGFEELLRAANAKGDLLTVADALTSGVIKIGLGASVINEIYGTGTTGVFATYFFSVAGHIYRSEGFANTNFMKSLRKPLEAKIEHEELKKIYTSSGQSISHEKVWLRYEADTRHVNNAALKKLLPPALKAYLADGFKVAFAEYKENCDAILPYTKVLCDIKNTDADHEQVRKSLRLFVMVCDKSPADAESCL